MDLDEEDIHQVETVKLSNTVKTTYVFLDSYVRRIKNARDNFYSNNQGNFTDTIYDSMDKVEIEDNNQLQKIAPMIAQLPGGTRSRDAMEKTGPRKIAIGKPGQQTMMVIGNPVGYTNGTSWTSVEQHKPRRMSSDGSPHGSWPAQDKYANGVSGAPIHSLDAVYWSISNFKQWERNNCWLCGLPNYWDKKKPEGEHKLPFPFMCAFGPGPVSKLCLVKNDDEDIKGLDYESNRSSLYSAITSVLRRQFDPAFKTWKDVCRGEEYAWSHPYCNKMKASINFIKFGINSSDEYVYYINYSAVKHFAERLTTRKPVKQSGRWKLSGTERDQPRVRKGEVFTHVLNKLLYECNQGNTAQINRNSGRGRYRVWGPEYVYKNILAQIKPLVYLLNESFPDIHGVDDQQEKIKTNIYFNYKRICRKFPILQERNETNKNLHDFFENIFEDDDGS
ncbi:MAG: hypothetical protein CXT73_04380, partial [Methanobacteriota archaeon]